MFDGIKKKIWKSENNFTTGEDGKVYRSLLNVAVGNEATIRRHHAKGAVRQRMLDLGFLPGRKVRVLRLASFGCPMELKISGYCVSLRRTEAFHIEIY